MRRRHGDRVNTSRRYLAFDIETAKVLPADAGDVLAHRPLGIACAAAVASDGGEPLVWHGNAGGEPAPRMSPEEVCAMIGDLTERIDDGYTLLTWNGLSFDLNILAEESGLSVECGTLALDHVDMMFHVVCALGHCISLGKAAEALGIPGKAGGMSGYQAPAMWAAGEHGRVIDYNVQDARLTLTVAEEAERRGRLLWITQRGRVGTMPLGHGWRCVGDACRMPLPDTSWMGDPPSRQGCLAWVPPVCRE
jgi:hypothetical protein